MTTIIAIDSRDGLIMASDLQATGYVIEFTSKIRDIRPNELIGCSGNAEYIEIFYRYASRSLRREERPTDYLQLLNDAVDEYCEYIDSRIDRLGLESVAGFRRGDCYPEGILAVDDGSTRKRLFTINTPEPCLEIPPIQHRACVGSGGAAATILLRVLENNMLTWRIDNQALTWTQFSWKTIGQFLWIVLRNISQIDPFSRGKSMYRLDGQRNVPVNYPELFEGDSINLELPQFIRRAIREMGAQSTLEVLKTLDLESILKDLGIGQS